MGEAELAEKSEALLMLEDAFSHIDEQQEYALQNWYLAELNKATACRTKLKEQYAVMLAQIDEHEKQLHWRWGDKFREAVEDDLAEQKGKKRSVDYLQGRAGFRMGKSSLEIADEDMAVKWAMENDCKSALKLKITRKGPLIKAFEADGIIPDGCVVRPAEDKFFPARPKPELTRGHAKRLLEK